MARRIHVLDSLGCAIGAMDDEPVQLVHGQVAEFDPRGACTLALATARDLAEQLRVDVCLTEDRTHFKHVASYGPEGDVAPR